MPRRQTRGSSCSLALGAVPPTALHCPPSLRLCTTVLCRPLSLHEAVLREWRCLSDHTNVCDRVDKEVAILDSLLAADVTAVVRARQSKGCTDASDMMAMSG